ncbi:hypothetical protein E1B28_000008 [Marasmius oreades]|uniref:Uncharacterized protein n=1 Tax=Marasmius oreades TaxID=181124 RepID=A0A9P7V0K2_9AGAR|nr:uncharacterized protein E1B28_000008 [Marasmius oreades]KAG7098032.1 hypothetical protein E1B28_000008 [Marasmius oreades]
MFVAILAFSPEGVDCPTQPSELGIESVVSQFVEYFTLVKQPTVDELERSGNFFLIASKPGPHLVCTYGNFSSNAINAGQYEGGQGSISDSLIFKSLDSLIFMNQSQPFNVSSTRGTDNTTSTSITMSPSSHSTENGRSLRKLKQSSRRRDSCIITPYGFTVEEDAMVTRERKGNLRTTSRLQRQWIHRQQPGEKARPVQSQRDRHSDQTASPPTSDVAESPVQLISTQEVENPATADPVPIEAPTNLAEQSLRVLNAPTYTEPGCIVMHVDSGWRPAGTSGPSYVDVPPSYNDAT